MRHDRLMLISCANALCVGFVLALIAFAEGIRWPYPAAMASWFQAGCCWENRAAWLIVRDKKGGSA